MPRTFTYGQRTAQNPVGKFQRKGACLAETGWSENWLWSAPLIALTVAFHVLVLQFIYRRVIGFYHARQHHGWSAPALAGALLALIVTVATLAHALEAAPWGVVHMGHIRALSMRRKLSSATVPQKLGVTGLPQSLDRCKDGIAHSLLIDLVVSPHQLKSLALAQRVLLLLERRAGFSEALAPVARQRSARQCVVGHFVEEVRHRHGQHFGEFIQAA